MNTNTSAIHGSAKSGQSTVRGALSKIKMRVEAFVGRRKLAAARSSSQLKLIVGSSGTRQPGWVATDVDYLNLLKPNDWERFFAPHSIAMILAEHVWEHLTPSEGLAAAMTCFHYLKRGGHLRIAVPDGNHTDPAYIEWVRVGGVGDGAHDHKVLYDYRSLTGLLQEAGFDVILREYFDENGEFHHRKWDANDGFIGRSAHNDLRNVNGRLNYTSLIVDGFVPADVRDS